MELLKRIYRTLRPSEQLGLFFLLIMVALYAYFDIPIIYGTRRIFLWFLVTFIAITVALVVQLLIQQDLKTVLYRHRLMNISRDWVPFIIFILVYDNLNDITRLINPYEFDSLFIAIDWVLFFGHHPTLLFEQVIRPWLTQWLSIAYMLYLISFFTTLGAFYALKKYDAFHETALSVLITIYVGFVLYLLFPCVGPILSQHSIHTVDLEGGGAFGFYNGVTDLYGSYKNYFHCFPSLHLAVTAVFWFFTWKHLRWLFYLYAPFILSLWFSTVYLRWHYVTDLLVGGLIAVYAVWLGPLWYNSWKKYRNKKR